jgi:hypothetical protein
MAVAFMSAACAIYDVETGKQVIQFDMSSQVRNEYICRKKLTKIMTQNHAKLIDHKLHFFSRKSPFKSQFMTRKPVVSWPKSDHSISFHEKQHFFPPNNAEIIKNRLL